MPLVRQLWLAIALITATTFAGSFLVSIHSASVYLEQQLQRKNLDNANSLALSMSQQAKDAVTLELQLAALFDSGHYQSITLMDPHGAIIVERIQDRSDTTIPEWFVRIFPIKSLPGRAQISDGWKQFGTVTVVSHNRFAYQSLWKQSLEMITWFVGIALLIGLAGILALRGIKHRLDAVVEQARAIAERRFITIDEPRTPELKSVVRAMNDMVGRVRDMFADEAHRLEDLQQKLNFDAVTGLANRDYFMGRIRETLASEKAASAGVLLLLRLHDLAEINNRIGHAETDTLLRNIGSILEHVAAEMPDRLAARLKGSDFALIAPNADDTDALARRLVESMTQLAHAEVPEIMDVFHIGAIPYSRGDQPGELLSAADQALAIAESRGANTWHAEAGKRSGIAAGNDEWRELLTDALADARLKLALYAVNDSSNRELHQEGMARLQVKPDGKWLSAGDFMPMAVRLNLAGQIDLGVVRLALDLLQKHPGELAINLASETIADWSFHNKLVELLRRHSVLCHRLWLEVPEYGVFREYEAFQDLCRTLKQLGCKVGIEHFGNHLNEARKLSELGLDYLKVDVSLVRDIAQNPGNQKLLKGLCRMAHGIGVRVIAIGVQDQVEQAALIELGIDGLTGPFIEKTS